jgi:hypothetical protein
MEKLEQLKNHDIYWLLFAHFTAFLVGPFAGLALFFCWCWAIYRHRQRAKIVIELMEKSNEHTACNPT